MSVWLLPDQESWRDEMGGVARLRLDPREKNDANKSTGGKRYGFATCKKWHPYFFCVSVFNILHPTNSRPCF